MTRALQMAAVLGLAAGLSGCVGGMILGIPLGPQTSNGLYVQAVAPLTADCVVDQTMEQLGGAMELGDGSRNANEYVAMLRVENRLEENGNTQLSTQRCPNYGKCGNTNSNDVEIVAAHVRYEYPIQPSSFRARYANQPTEGILSAVSTTAFANIKTGSIEAVPVVFITRDVAAELFRDRVAKTESMQTQGFDVIVRGTLEGRTAGGGRVTTNEFIFKVNLSQGKIRNCTKLDAECQNIDPNTRAARNVQCLPDQDVPECSPVCI